ncbi:MAG TPA: glutamine synthetase family protein [Burkholderiaceae bacterium]|nr:glutamine synthetase family protein [Burkholderiaceae bacterium]
MSAYPVIAVADPFPAPHTGQAEHEALRLCQLRDIRTVECALSDLASVARGKIQTTAEFSAQRGTRLPSIIFGTTVVGGEPRSVYENLIPATYPDVALKPDWSTFAPDPLIAQRATVLCDVSGSFVTPRGVQVEAASLSPRSILKRVLQRLEARGLAAQVAPELEFFLVAIPGARQGAGLPPAASPFHPGVRENFIDIFSLERTSAFDPFFATLFAACRAQQIPVTGFSHEAAASQYEVNFAPAAPLAQADAVFRFKRLAREVALRYGFAATFLAKPYTEGPGSGMHWHMSMQQRDGGRNVFSGADGDASPELLAFVAGMQRHALATTALIAPYQNSYLRFQKHEAAPAAASWGQDDRSVAFRIPVSDAANRRIENRLPGADANPYLLLAAMIAAGLDGMERRLAPASDPDQLPLSLDAALQAFCRDDWTRELFGPQFVDTYDALKRHELAQREAAPSGLEWDIANLLHHA